MQMPMIDIEEVGTGGGSIARVEVGNALRVGPESAGAAPGPVCYGARRHRADHHRRQSGARAAGADRFLGGEMQLDVAGAKAAIDATRSRRRSGSIAIEAADGIVRIAVTKMAHVVRG